ncbi:hypothetical protein JMM81_07735 [Bacillus sp. V3B]|uniref:hypothetical protein n=1 Tax=Bacillus sp. V3B TaxID=2804915 RepID=UPI00210D41C7|nr:hypothetical protein [Bacillus sp. V3B]MCQ6274855.1 hypothetical protein [Bacillus sp. V3B]
MENIYKLDQFLTFDYMKKLVESNGMSIVKELPADLEKTFTYYKQLLKQSLQAPYFLTEDRHFQQKIPVGSDEYYTIRWNIPKLRYIVKQSNIPLTSLPMEHIKTSIQQHKHSSLNTSESTNRKTKQSIIAVFYPPILSKYIIIDGIEKAICQYENGDTAVKAYVLEPSVHLQGMTRDVYRNLFAIHFNYSLICSYITDNLTFKELEEHLFPVY